MTRQLRMAPASTLPLSDITAQVFAGSTLSLSNITARVFATFLPCTGCEDCWGWRLKRSMHEESSIPTDVPKGHLVVYVGERYKRFVIKISLLKHPLFRALLDQARDEYDFSADSKLCIPCNESLFLDVVRCACSPQDRGLHRCM